MTPTVHDPNRLDVEAFAQDAGELHGQHAVALLPRLLDGALPADQWPQPQTVAWSAHGFMLQRAGVAARVGLKLAAVCNAAFICQRCLQPMTQAIEARREILFVPGEELAARLDEELEEDVLALTPSVDLFELIEDELILCLPIVPRHDSCTMPLGAAQPGDQFENENPFAALTALRPPTAIN